MAKQFILTECDEPLVTHQAHIDLEERVARLEAEASRLPAENRADRRITELVERVERLESALHRISSQVKHDLNQLHAVNSRRIESLQSQVRKLFAEQHRMNRAVGMPETAPEAETVPTEYRQDRFRFIEDVLRAMSDHLGRIEEQLARKPGSKK